MDRVQESLMFGSSQANSNFLINSTTTNSANLGFASTTIMHALTSLLLVGATGLQSVLGFPHRASKRADIDSFIATEEPIALEGVLCNIGTDGCKASGAAAGVVVASPSQSDPPYFYTWTRDAGLVFKSLVERFSVSYNETLQELIHDYIASQAELQTVSNPSGSFSDGTGLAEPKFNVDLTEYTGAWGRPQRDGPALRSIAIIGYAKWLVANGYPETASEVAWPVIRNDVAYVAQYWNNTGFDLWEEVSGSSFFTIASQYRALVEANALATDVGTTCSACEAIAPHLLCFMQSFWSDSLGGINSNINQNNGRTGLDANSILTSIHSFDPSLGCDSLTFQPCSDKALSNHKAVTDSFRSWSINSGIAQGSAVAVGRYIEDSYYNGNPWILATFAAAEQLYDAVQVWDSQGSLDITSTSLAFFQDLDSSASVGTYASGSDEYETFVAAVLEYADGYMAMNQQYLPSDGSMAEQYDKSTGDPLSAADLTWSYASFLTAAAARAKTQSSTFGWAVGAPSLPDTCLTTSVDGAYITATATTFPTSMVPGGGDETITTTAPEPTTTSCYVSTTFDVLIETVWGETIKVVGSIDALGNWDTGSAIPLSASDYTDSNPLWSLTMSMTPSTSFEFKYIKVAEDGSVTWEADPNRSYTLPSDCGDTATISGSWQ
ncbi:glycoside hydrolase family 15 protein [Zalerion maritima]|uniref:Glucoamylase n=1 Tax=Zalerion maritima TaxID=339359 RepID=A0AAD5WRP0_9PEZI|nr:glycoside hydrolase family 15 protein [Zalerion maritima]